MIQKPTVLILGAGASIPFGFPSGRALLDKIVNGSGSPQGTDLGQALLHCGIDENALKQFSKTLRYSQKASVDAFLEHRQDFFDIGKMAIAAALIPYEQEESMLAKGDWYQYLFNAMNASFSEFSRNKLSIITYNYDRSLEHFLTTALMHSYKKDIFEAQNAVRSIPIIHLHGKLGELSDEGRWYNPQTNGEILRKAATQIKIIHEMANDEPAFLEARCILRDAKQVCFLGFGYDRINTARLFNHPDILRNKTVLCGTAYGLTDMEKQRIKEEVDLRLDFGGATTRQSSGP